jgi:dTDP-4-dehydrorhamnose 3,5-epimerase-like enzyme
VNIIEPWLVDCRNFQDSRGSLHVFDNLSEFAFVPQRIFIVTEIPEGVSRGSHAHKKAWQILIALNGFVEIEIENTHSRTKFVLTPSEKALCVPPNNWLEFRTENVTTSLIVLASTVFDEEDYIYEKPIRHEAPDG